MRQYLESGCQRPTRKFCCGKPIGRIAKTIRNILQDGFIAVARGILLVQCFLKYSKPLLPTSPPLLHFERQLPSTSVESIIPSILNEPKKPESASTMMALACSRIKGDLVWRVVLLRPLTFNGKTLVSGSRVSLILSSLRRSTLRA